MPRSDKPQAMSGPLRRPAAAAEGRGGRPDGFGSGTGLAIVGDIAEAWDGRPKLSPPGSRLPRDRLIY